MIITLCSWVVLTLLFAIMAHFTIWARTGNSKPRLLSVILFFVGAAISFAALFLGAGVSPPCIPGLTAPKTQFVVLGFLPLPNVRIDVFYNDAAYGGSRVCYIPWSDKIANELVEAQQHKMQLGMEIPGLANGKSQHDGGEPSTFPLQAQEEMEKPSSDIQAP
jgi:hypothetical protein